REHRRAQEAGTPGTRPPLQRGPYPPPGKRQGTDGPRSHLPCKMCVRVCVFERVCVCILLCKPYWYMTNDHAVKKWNTLVADESNMWKNVGTTRAARHQKTKISMSKRNGNLIGKFDLTIGHLDLNQKPPTDEVFQIIRGISGLNNKWFLMVEQTANATHADCVVCMGPTPMLRIIPPIIPVTCVIEVMSKTTPNNNCGSWDLVFPLTTSEKEKPTFSIKVAPGNFTCINRILAGVQLGRLNHSSCKNAIIMPNDFIPLSRGDIWWWCGDDRLFDRLPRNVIGYCALVTLLLPVSVHKRELWLTETDPTYIDAIGVPRGVPNKYKLVNQVATSWESSICWWCTINKNVDRINYIHYHLSATSIMTFQNRIALDMLLAEKGGVCTMFGEQCCTFIPNNTAADGSLTKATEGLRTLNAKMKDHSGVYTTMWDSWLGVFGKYRSLVASALVSIAVFMAILTLCGCCCIPCLRSLCNGLISTAITPEETQLHPLLNQNDDDNDDDVDLNTAGLFLEDTV
uniref:Envelope glycoprotein n=1 Tax=Oryzias latipes TaxID=8090 RepID=A0A3B3H687_ORYLA